MSKTLVTFAADSPEETSRLAQAFAGLVRGGDFISLEGDLGAGKTFFVRALAQALGVKENVASPTFVLQRIYTTGPQSSVRTLLHYDLYRLQSPEELADIGFDECPPDGAVLAEWGNRFPDSFPPEAIRIALHYTGETSRQATVTFPDKERASALRDALG